MLRLLSLASIIAVVAGNDNGLALTPPMGWRSWNFMLGDVSQEKILAQVEALVQRRNGKPSLFEAGYTHVGIDDGWQACGTGFNHSFHSKTGKPLVNASRFPDMHAMNRKAKAQGVSMGWYGNNCGCSEKQQFGNIGGHVVQDADATADYGFEGLKVDGCGPSINITQWTAALNDTGRPVLLEDCLTKGFTRRGLPAPIPLATIFETCPGHFFRLVSDIAPQFYSTMYNLIATFNKHEPFMNATHSGSRPGCWVYNDMLEVGVKLSVVESKTHFAAWCISSSPLILGYDLTNASVYDSVYDIVTNKRALAVNQQFAGHSGLLVANATSYFEAATAHGAGDRVGKLPEKYPTWQIWRKPLVSPPNAQAVLVINLSEEPQDVSFAYADIAAALGSRPKAEDVWSGNAVDLGTDGKRAAVRAIPAHDSVFVILSPAAA